MFNIKQDNGITTKKEQVYTIIKNRILSGIYKHGNRILEDNIANELNVSKSPIREALKELSGEGFVVIVPNKGVFVKKLTKQDIIEILDFRTLIEKYSIKKIIENASDDSLNELSEIYEKMKKVHADNDTNKYARIDAQFHDTIYRLSGNMLMYKMAVNIFYLFQPFRVFSLNSKKRFEESLIEHKEIVDGLYSRNFQKTWAIAKTHLHLASIEVINFLERSESDSDNSINYPSY
jgi:DNA-binding GntR family transcriptional regulator